MPETAERPETDAQVFIFSDGSGTHSDGYGAGAAMVVSERYKLRAHGLVAGTGFNTLRGEITGVMVGLRLLLEHLGNNPTVVRGMQLSVLCHVDNSFVARAINAKELRLVENDLWRTFSYYDELFRIAAVHVPRNSTVEMTHADMVASTGRSVIKEYFQSTKLPEQ